MIEGSAKQCKDTILSLYIYIDLTYMSF